MKFLMCRPDHFAVQYAINPWMNVHILVEPTLAMKQWENLYQTILKCGAEVELISPVSGLPDLVFTANGGLLYHKKMILAHFHHSERRGETPYFNDWFQQAGFEVVNQVANHPTENTPFFEGAGDALLAGEKIFAAYGFRSEKRFYEQTDYFDSNPIIYCELVSPHFYHLDTCFCPLTPDKAIWYPEAFTPESQQRMVKNIELIPVNDLEAKRFACNAVVIGKQIILPSQCPEITRELTAQGYSIYACDMDEFLKSGGACKCLTLQLTA